MAPSFPWKGGASVLRHKGSSAYIRRFGTSAVHHNYDLITDSRRHPSLLHSCGSRSVSFSAEKCLPHKKLLTLMENYSLRNRKKPEKSETNRIVSINLWCPAVFSELLILYEHVLVVVLKRCDIGPATPVGGAQPSAGAAAVRLFAFTMRFFFLQVTSTTYSDRLWNCHFCGQWRDR